MASFRRRIEEGAAMKTIADVMSRDVTSVTPDDTIQRAAELMDDLDIVALADLVLDETDEDETLDTLRDISSPIAPDQPSTPP
jgi:CBS-domain-containing membrane protein